MSDDHPYLQPIEGGKGKKKKPARKKREISLWECPECKKLDGVPSTTVMEVRRMPYRNARGKIVGGSKKLICADCFMQGRKTFVT